MITQKSRNPQMLINKLSDGARSFSEKVKSNRKTLTLCMIATFVWGFAAHAYMFLQSSFSHDSLNELNGTEFGNKLRIQFGRAFVPTYRALTRGFVALPWLIGLLALFYIGLAVFLTVKLFSVKSKPLTVLIAGVYTANLTVTALTATFIHDLDCNMMSMLLAVLAVYVWKKYKFGFIAGCVLVGVSMGLYQANVSVTIVLVLMTLILEFLDGTDFKKVLIYGIKSVIMLITGGMIYVASVKIICTVTGIGLVSGFYNSVDTAWGNIIPNIKNLTLSCYIYTVRSFFFAVSSLKYLTVFAIHTVLTAVCFVLVMLRLFKKKISVLSKLAVVVMIALLPLGMNVSFILSGGGSHDIMHFAVWLTYLFFLIIAWRCTEQCFINLNCFVQYGQRIVTVCLILVLLWGNVQLSNATYLKKDFEQSATMSLLTRVVCKIEERDDYVPGETPVVFVGVPSQSLRGIPGFEKAYRMVGSDYYYALGWAEHGYYARYFEYYMASTLKIADEQTWSGLQGDPRVAQMPCYPDDGGMKTVDGVLVVKLGDRGWFE